MVLRRKFRRFGFQLVGHQFLLSTKISNSKYGAESNERAILHLLISFGFFFWEITFEYSDQSYHIQPKMHTYTITICILMIRYTARHGHL